MIIKKHNISGATAVLLISTADTVNASYINFANVHATDAADLDMYLTDGTDTYYIFKKVNIPAGASLVISGPELDFDRDLLSLYVKLGASDSTVDVLTKY